MSFEVCKILVIWDFIASQKQWEEKEEEKGIEKWIERNLKQ